MPTQELLEMCDRIGMLVFDETRRMSSCEDDLTALRTMVKTRPATIRQYFMGIGERGEAFFQDKPRNSQQQQETKGKNGGEEAGSYTAGYFRRSLLEWKGTF